MNLQLLVDETKEQPIALFYFFLWGSNSYYNHEKIMSWTVRRKKRNLGLNQKGLVYLFILAVLLRINKVKISTASPSVITYTIIWT